MRPGVIESPDSNSAAVRCSPTRNFTCVPPTSITRVMGDIDVAAGEHTGDVSTVNGSIHIRDNAVVENAHTVNGSISLEPHATAAELKTVNGPIRLGQGAR